MGSRAFEPELCANGAKAVGEIDELLFLPDSPFETIANEGAGYVDQMQTARIGKAKGRAIEGALLVVERRLLGILGGKKLDKTTCGLVANY